TGQGLDALIELLKDSVSAFVGSSGVGKSSLINAIQPDLALKTQVVREKFLKGQHTTTTAELVTLELGGMVVDTPGMREFALWHDKDTDEDDVIASFPEIQAAAVKCKFRNCSHSHEPGCEVRHLVEFGEIEQARYRNYLKLTK
ncbi:MAG: ribosome small subunit-dependent GTPase A, partial [Bacillota bacterium]|nr:ribosome small subunit-dependent GTPase A [Bacillota bacterium]